MRIREYLGDGVYVEKLAHGALKLTTQSDSTQFTLSPEVYTALVAFVHQMESQS